MPVEYVSAGHSGLAPPPSKVHEHGLPKKDVQCMFIEYDPREEGRNEDAKVEPCVAPFSFNLSS